MDPALWELLASDDLEGDEVEAIIRLVAPHMGAPGVRLVARFGDIATCRLDRRSVLRLRRHDNVLSLKAPRPLGPEPEPWPGSAPPATEARTAADRHRPQIAPTGAGVVVGVADWGCDFQHADFRHVDGSTRLRAIWNQRGAGAAGPPPYGYGTVHSRGQIDRALRASDPYDALGYHPGDADRAGSGAHGTHVMGIAAGNGQAGGPAGIAPEAELVFVHLADRGTAGLANLGDSVRILEAVDFVSRTAGHRPWVVNLSLGRTGGPHDGSTLAEAALESLLSAGPGRCCVLSAGNYFRKATHTSGHVRPGATEHLVFTTMAADFTPNELEVWYSGRDELAVRLEPPTGETSPWVPLGERLELVDDGRAIGRLYHRAHDPNNDDNHIDLFLDPWAPAGAWTLSLRARKIRDGVFHAWLERDEACPSCQARFTDRQSDASTTTGTLANGHLPLIVGAYDPRSPTREVAQFSSSGPTRDGRPKPDLVAPGVQVLAARSAPPGSRRSPGTYVRKSGTSMAAPHVTGAVALCLQVAPWLRADEIYTAVVETARRRTLSGWDAQRRGAGELDIESLVARVASLGHRRRIDRREMSMESIAERPASRLPMGPDRAYREIVYSNGSTVPSSIDAAFDVLARPGELPTAPPQAGDVLVRVALGEAGHGHADVLSSPAVPEGESLEWTGPPAEHDGPGFYATVTHDWPPRLANRCDSARRVLDRTGRMPPGQLLLRPRPPLQVEPPEPAAPNEPDEEDEIGIAEGSPGVAVDATAAVPPFTDAERRTVLEPLLTPRQSADAIAWTTKMHAAASGVSVTEIAAALASYVDPAAITAAIASHNKANPAKAIAPGTAPVDAAFVESVHQFQRKCYANGRDHDGRAGESTLDSLGLIARTAKVFRHADRTNTKAQKRLNARRSKVAAAGGGLTAANWFDHMVDPSFLGQRTRYGHGMHVELVRRLRKAERHLLTLPAFQGMTPVRLGGALGVVEVHRGARPNAGDNSLHTFGLAVDIAYCGNPWMRRTTSWDALKRAALLVSGVTLRQRTAGAYFHSLGSDSTRSTESIWDELRRRSDELATYLQLADDPTGLARVLEARQAAGTAGVLAAGESLDAATARWRASMRKDRRQLEKGDFEKHDSPTNGFLHLDRNLVVALRDQGCLVWGAVDFGPGRKSHMVGSGDVMHFDARIGGVGSVVAEGVQPVPETGHPCASAPPPAPTPATPEEGDEAPESETFDLSAPDRSPAGDDPHGAPLARIAELSSGRPGAPAGSRGDGREGLMEFDAPEHGAAGLSVQRMIDAWAMNGLIDGGAFIDTGRHRTADQRDQPIAAWTIFTPHLTRTSAGKLVSYTELTGGVHSHAHWYYIAPDPIGHPRPWNPGTLRKALLAGEAVALSIGQIILLAGDLFGSFEALTGRGKYDRRSRPAINLMAGIDAYEPWAHALLALRQFLDEIGMLGALRLMRRVPEEYSQIERDLRRGGGDQELRRARELSRFLRSARGPTRFSEAHVLSRVLEVGGRVTHRQVQIQAPWLPDKDVPPTDKHFAIERDPFSISVTNGHYLDLALRNKRHFAPLNWATFEAYHRRALEAIGRNMAKPRNTTVRHPVPADAIALTAFGCHFLTDAFASGHMRTPVEQLGMRGALASKIMHDLDNSYGLLVENGRGQRWRAFGDEYLHPGGAGSWRAVQSAVLEQLASRRPRGFDLSPDTNRNRMMEAVGSAFKQLHYEAQRQGRVLTGNPFGLVLAQNRGTSTDRLAGDDLAVGDPHDAKALTDRIDADVETKVRYLKQLQPRPLPAGTDPANVLANHPPLLVRHTNRQGAAVAVVPPKTPYRWFDRDFRRLGMDSWLRLRWHGRTLEQEFSEYVFLEDALRRRPPPWMQVLPDRVRSLVGGELPED